MKPNPSCIRPPCRARALQARHRQGARWSSFALLAAGLVFGLIRPAGAATPSAAHGGGAVAVERAAPAAAAATPAPVSKPAAQGPAAVAAPAAVDPMERLRQRLSERVAVVAPPATSPASQLEVRVVAKKTAASPTAHGHAAPAAQHKAVGAHVKKAGAGGAHAAAHWDYTGPAGPQTWGGLKPEFSLCANGQRQSPIDIRGGLPVNLEPIRFDYRASPFGVVDNGHTVQANLPGGNFIEVGGRRFELLQFHFHRPSEERIDGRQFEMSLHLVHKDDQGRLAVVALLLDRGAPHPLVQSVWNNLPLEKLEPRPAREPLQLQDLLPPDRRYYTYMGSLTTPPCSEGVQWLVMRHPVAVSLEQIELFARMYPMNARPIQQASGRRILQSN